MTITEPVNACVLYVSPCGRHFTTDPWEAQLLARDVSQMDLDGVARAYRRLDAEWFAWLAHRTALALRMAREGALSQEQADAIAGVQDRLRPVRAWALLHIGKEPLAKAINRGIRQDYWAPVCRLTIWPAIGPPDASRGRKG